MAEQAPNPPHITMTETMLRFYVFLGQYIDRCLDEEHRRALPEQEFQQHLATTHDEVVQLLATNRVVKAKPKPNFSASPICARISSNSRTAGNINVSYRKNGKSYG